MKTETRSLIVKLVREESGMRPHDLAKKLALSPQAIHRHLRSLLGAGFLERQGRGPRTRYVIAGAPQLDGSRRWYSSDYQPGESPTELVCETRDVFSARLGRLAAFATAGLEESEISLAIAAAGEVGNNCFDHNLGNWRDVPGCWFEARSTGGRLWICIADRGQGVFHSLRRVVPTLPDEQSALVAAFEQTISGRAPENRGNGLKFVRNIVAASTRRGLACRSGAGLVDYGTLGRDCRAELERFPSRPAGTITLILWSLK